MNVLICSYSYLKGVIVKFKHLNQPYFDRERDGAVSEIIDKNKAEVYPWGARPWPQFRQAYNEGYKQALRDWSIWKNGVQHIGCMQRPIKEIIEEVDKIDKKA
jgi:hypothetical protein